MSEQRKVTIDEKEYNFKDLGQEQQILIDHIENCRKRKSSLAFEMDRENVAEGAFAKMLTESFEEKEENKEEEIVSKGSPKDA